MRRVNHPAIDYKNLFESLPGRYLILDTTFLIVAVSDTYLQATMTERHAIVGRPLFEVFPDNPNDPDATGVNNLRTSLEKVLASASPHTMAVQKYDIRRPDGGFEERYWSPQNSPVLGSHGQVILIVHGVEDVTEFVHLKQKGKKELEDVKSELQAMLGKSSTISNPNTFNQKIVSLVSSDSDNDSNERKNLEMQLRQSQKMEAIGRLAGGIAHDFNNHLAVIKMTTELALDSLQLDTLQKDSHLREDLEEIKRAGDRAAALTKQLLAFSRQQILQPTVLSLNAIVSEMDKMLRRLIGEDIEFVLNLSKDLGATKADAGQIEQVVMNLVVNARDAMPKGGRAVIETMNVELDENHGQRHYVVRPGSYVMLAVTDTGKGMDAATQEKIFEPFFTTKEKDKGTGLGLATVYGIVKQSNGYIWVHSEPQKGTTFKIYLPRCDEAASREASISNSVAPVKSCETILVAEDEEQVRKLICRVLGEYGYKILEAKNGVEAVEIANGYKDPIHLLVTDMVMPNMSGRDLALHASSFRPDLRVLYLSGYTPHAVSESGMREQGASFLQKPFSRDALLTKIRQVLTP